MLYMFEKGKGRAIVVLHLKISKRTSNTKLEHYQILSLD